MRPTYFLALALMFPAITTAQVAATTSALSVAPDGYYTMGQGYDSDRDYGLNWCVNIGSTIYEGAPNSSVLLTSTYSFDQLVKDLSLTAESSLKTEKFTVTPTADFARHSTSDSRSLTFIWAAKYDFPNQVGIPVSGSQFTAEGTAALAGGPAHFRAVCGNRWVQQIAFGGRLYFAARLEFTKESEKTTFVGKLGGGIGSAVTFNSTFKSTVDATHVSGTIKISAIQSGGKVENLGKIFGTTSGSTAPVATCSFENSADCEKLISSLTNYAANDFPTQFSSGYSAGAVVGYVLKDYGAMGAPELPSVVSPEVAQARSRLDASASAVTSDLFRVDTLLNLIPNFVDASKTTELTGASSILSNNQAAVNDAGITCWHFPEECLAAEASANALLTAFDRDVLSNSRKIGSQSDACGGATIAVFQRTAATAQSLWDGFEVQVPEDYVVIGGGVEGKDFPYGNMLTGSYPGEALDAWFVSTKDHLDVDPVVVKGYAIGLKIRNVSPASLRGSLYVATTTSAPAQWPSAYAYSPAGYTMLGGGFRVNYVDPGNIATATYPASSTSWYAAAKDHIQKSVGQIDVFAISIANALSPGLSVARVQGSTVAGAHPSSQVGAPAGYALSSCGGSATSSGSGQLLWKVKPLQIGSTWGCEAGSKDHRVSSPGYVTAWALGIRACGY